MVLHCLRLKRGHPTVRPSQEELVNTRGLGRSTAGHGAARVQHVCTYGHPLCPPAQTSRHISYSHWRRYGDGIAPKAALADVLVARDKRFLKDSVDKGVAAPFDSARFPQVWTTPLGTAKRRGDVWMPVLPGWEAAAGMKMAASVVAVAGWRHCAAERGLEGAAERVVCGGKACGLALTSCPRQRVPACAANVWCVQSGEAPVPWRLGQCGYRYPGSVETDNLAVWKQIIWQCGYRYPGSVDTDIRAVWKQIIWQCGYR
eukprot:364968-Chlamydomonas_euryale.AAC.10